ncbi:16S rRNA (guanine(966)-N(2))-methyltransferase RsmD [Schaalia sp. ZJ405]|uniref:16S rRNA (guanine(966)-N(2))-methyltransferase RsmD n=1 Tax=Schaalia sp. ZJ405 TaxID=2709403 RepID=UPI0013ECA3E6|nr:16S rRNA (guanine(966)-N(2))-methyltransferase RsmD [Schaalia sp. ZJ405]QPK81895.1 16S rRNA (guanine(966)-N(2))-methyltransferase RsmD [Schaalia sp. ZJ405]
MTRIVSGSAKGRVLRVPPQGTRPTSERVREALFSRLEHWGMIEGTRVLDLYAGTGALGLEAVSRGASDAVLVEKSPKAARILRENVALTELDAGVRSADVHAFLGGRTGEPLTGEFGLVFIDPPYDIDEDRLGKTLELLGPWLSADALVIVERSVRSPQPRWPVFLRVEDRRTWGDTVAWMVGPPTPKDS